MLNKCKRISSCIHTVLQECLQLSSQSQIPEEPVLSNHGSECHRACHLINPGSAMGFSAYASGLQDTNSGLWWEHPCICHYNLKHDTLASYHHTPKPHCTVLLCGLANTHRLYRLTSTSPAKLAALGVCSLPGHISAAAARSLFYPGRKECTLHQNFGKTTHNHNLFLFLSQEQNIVAQAPSTISRFFTCLDRIVHLTEASTRNEQLICLPRNSVESCEPSSVFIQQYAWGSKNVSLDSSKEKYLYQVRRRAFVNLFCDSLIIRGRRKAGWVP